MSVLLRLTFCHTCYRIAWCLCLWLSRQVSQDHRISFSHNYSWHHHCKVIMVIAVKFLSAKYTVGGLQGWPHSVASLIKWLGSLNSWATGDSARLWWWVPASLEEWSLYLLSVQGDFICQPVLQTVAAAPASCLIGSSPVELCLSWHVCYNCSWCPGGRESRQLCHYHLLMFTTGLKNVRNRGMSREAAVKRPLVLSGLIVPVYSGGP